MSCGVLLNILEAEWQDLPLGEALERLTSLGAAGNVTWEQAQKALDEFLARVLQPYS